VFAITESALKLNPVSTKQARIAELARKLPGRRLVSLNHHLDKEWLLEACRQTRKDGAVGVDGVAWDEYSRQLDANLASLLDRAKAGERYRAPAVRRVHIPKGNGETRPLGIPTLEDKILQRAVAMLLTPVYEQDFRDCSYGFRPGRSAHQALDRVWREIGPHGCWVIDADISKFFDTLDKAVLRDFLNQRIGDGVIRRLIGKWLKAGVLEQGTLHYPEQGTPQGGVISPLLSNIYLHHVLDLWFEQDVKPRLRGKGWLVRYADDFVMGFEREDDARRVYEVLFKRFARFGLRIHPEKTRLLPFFPPATPGQGETFTFLGFTHAWSVSQRGAPYTRRQTASKKFTKGLDGIRDYCRNHRTRPLREQWEALRQRLRGHAQYFGIIGNSRRVSSYFYEARRIWRTWLNRRSSQRDVTWERFYREIIPRFPLIPPTIRHSQA
jgi:group II intron reverse transcriptase/maturase